MPNAVQKNSMDAATVITAAIIASAIGALFYNLLPLYLGSAQDYRGLDNRSIGFLSAAFFLGYNVVTISAFFWIRRISWGLITAVSMPVAALSLYAGTVVESYAILLVSVAIAGGAFAAIYGLGTTILGDTSNPGRWYGIKIAAEALTGAVLLLILPATAIARWGFDGAVFGMIIFMILLSPFLFWIPARGSKGPESEVVPIDVPEPAASGHGVPAAVHLGRDSRNPRILCRRFRDVGVSRTRRCPGRARPRSRWCAVVGHARIRRHWFAARGGYRQSLRQRETVCRRRWRVPRGAGIPVRRRRFCPLRSRRLYRHVCDWTDAAVCRNRDCRARYRWPLCGAERSCDRHRRDGGSGGRRGADTVRAATPHCYFSVPRRSSRPVF